MIVGFTGTRSGLSTPQRDKFLEIIKTFDIVEFHHGDCVGADAHVHRLVKTYVPGVEIHVHPPLLGNCRAFSEGGTKTYPERGYMERNHDIVNMCDILIACPRTMTIRRGGTWYTIREAIFLRKKVYVISPAGTVIDGYECSEKENDDG